MICYPGEIFVKQKGKGDMDAKVYRAALEGSWEKLESTETWYDQVTPMGNNVLHAHVGRPFIKRGVLNNEFIIHKEIRKSIEFIKSVLDQEINVAEHNLLWDENADGDIPLHLAARFGHVEAVREFIRRVKVVDPEEVKKMLNKTNKKKDTALHEAARAGHGQVVSMLIEAHRTCLYEANDAKETPLYLAAESGIDACVVAILDNSASSKLVYDYKGPCGRTVLHALVQWKDPEILHKILKKDDSLVRLKDDEGSTPVHLVVADNKIKHLEILLSYDKKSIELSATYVRDKEGRTPLHIATIHCSWESIHELITYCPDCIEMVDNRDKNVLHYAANWACIRKLMKFLKLENELKKLMNSKDSEGNTPLHLVAINVPYINCNCIADLRSFIKDHIQYINLFNNENLTVLDILSNYDFDNHFTVFDLMWIKRVGAINAPVCGRVALKKKELEDEKRATTAKDVLEKNATAHKEAAQNQIVVAALVATVSFAAGFTVPGGFNQNQNDPDIGTAVMSKKTLFKAFLISDTIALALSLVAVLFYFQATCVRYPKAVAEILTHATTYCAYSIGAMMLAFVTGVYAVVPNSHPLHIALIVISAFFFLQYSGTFLTAPLFFVRKKCRPWIYFLFQWIPELSFPLIITCLFVSFYIFLYQKPN